MSFLSRRLAHTKLFCFCTLGAVLVFSVAQAVPDKNSVHPPDTAALTPLEAPSLPVAPERVNPTERLTPEALPRFLEAVRLAYHLPALGAAVVFRDKIAVATVGVRKVGDPTPVSDDDGWQLGSCTKSMTATLMAMLVEDGKLSWDSTLSQMLPDLSPKMNPAFRQATLRQLLQHRAGLPTKTVPHGTTYTQWNEKTSPLDEQRLEYTQAFLAQDPQYPPGTKMLYSNVGYVIAATIAQRVTGKSWEELIQSRLFEPLDMKSATIGTRVGPELLEPWPHSQKDGQPVPAPPGEGELPMVVAPCGLVRLSLADWGKYARFFLRGLRGQSQLLKAQSFQTLTTPATIDDPVEDYACGWKVVKRTWSAGPILTHTGTNLFNHAEIWMAPTENFAVLVTTNTWPANTACDDVSRALVSELARLSKT